MKYNSDSLFHVLMTRLADAMILNILFIITSLPIITIGVSWASMYYVTLKIIQDEKNEEISILKNYLHSFKQNLLQGIVIWILCGGIVTLLLVVFSVMSGRDPGRAMCTSLFGAAVAMPFFAVSVVRPRHLGRADGAVIMMIGLLTGAKITALTLFIALIISSACGCVLLIRNRGKAWRQQGMAFLPCLAAGFIGAQLL